MSTREIHTASEQQRTRTDERRHAGERTVCPECGGRVTSDEEHGETVCAECGLVIDDRGIDHGPEWRAYTANERDSKSRVGAPTTKMLHDKGLSSQISWQNRDAYGKSLSARQRRKMQRLRTWDERFRTTDHKDRNLKQALGEIDRMASALGLPENVRETASVIYRRALSEDLLPGRTIEGVATSALYAAARQMGTPRSIDEVAAVSRVGATEFKRTYRYVARELNLGVPPANPASYVGRLASELDVDAETERRARELLRTAEGTNAFNGKSPVGLAAAAIYAAGRLTDAGRTQKEIAAVANVSEVTIRDRYQELLAVAEERGRETDAVDGEDPSDGDRADPPQAAAA
ncbi:MAG: transcription initiation factor IIB family protein [Salinigranum sp.]